MRTVIKASSSAKAKKAVECSKGSIEDMLDAFEGRINQLENYEDGIATATEALNPWEMDYDEDIQNWSESDIEECGDVYMSTDVEAGTKYYETDPRRLISEEDMQEQAVGAMLSVMDQSDLDIDEAYQAWVEWCTEVGQWAKKQIESGNALSVYDR